MKTVLLCIPIRNGLLKQFQDFVQQTSHQKANEWKSMLKRYDIASVKIWYKNLNGIDYAFVYHKVGREFEEKIKEWDTSQHPFDQWFNQQIMAVYATSPTNSSASLLLELIV